MPEEFDPFGTDKTPMGGLPPYTGVVTSAEFLVSEDYNADALLLEFELELTGLVDSDDDPPFDTRKVSFSCGKEWESLDGGATAVHESGVPQQFNTNTRVGILIDRAFYDASSDEDPPTFGGDPEGEAVDGLGLRQHFIDGGHTPFDSAGWVGLELGFHTEKRDYGKKIGVISFDMPFMVVGAEEEKPKPKGKPKKAAAAKKPAAKKAGGRTRKAKAKAEPEAEVAVEPIDMEAAKEAVLDADGTNAAEDFAEFVAAAYAVVNELGLNPEAGGYNTLMEWVDDEDDGAWSEYE